MVYKRKKRYDAKKRTIPAHTRSGNKVSSYKRTMRKDIRKNRTIKRNK